MNRVRVLIPTPLYSYTGGSGRVEAAGATVGGVLEDLDRRYPGLRFRIVDEQGAVRTHIRIFLNEETAGLSAPVREGDEVALVAALSGG